MDVILNLGFGLLFLLVGIPSILRSDKVRNLPTVPRLALLICITSLYGMVAFGSLLIFHGNLWKWPFVYCFLSIFLSVILFSFTRPR